MPPDFAPKLAEKIGSVELTVSCPPLLLLLLFGAAAAAASQGEEDEAEKDSSWKGWRRLLGGDRRCRGEGRKKEGKRKEREKKTGGTKF